MKMIKSVVLICLVSALVIEARPKWQFLPAKPGYVPVYIQTGDTPLEEINPYLAEAFHALPAGRSAGNLLAEIPQPEETNEPDIQYQSYDKKDLEKKKKATEVVKPEERR